MKKIVNVSNFSLLYFMKSNLIFLKIGLLYVFVMLFRRHDNQHNDTHHNDIQDNHNQHFDTQHNDTQHNDTQHNDTQHNNEKSRHST
jgi:hypothetical protein